MLLILDFKNVFNLQRIWGSIKISYVKSVSSPSSKCRILIDLYFEKILRLATARCSPNILLSYLKHTESSVLHSIFSRQAILLQDHREWNSLPLNRLSSNIKKLSHRDLLKIIESTGFWQSQGYWLFMETFFTAEFSLSTKDSPS